MVIIGLFIYWQPWAAGDSTEQRKITVTGEATVKAEADEFQFSPYYERATVAEVGELSKSITAKLKELGVKEGDIKSDISNYDDAAGRPEPALAPVEKIAQAMVYMTVTVQTKAMAQKVQDYLTSTNPQGAVTPYPSFSKAKQRELENTARDEAVADARKRAEKTTQTLDAKLGKVLEIKEANNEGGFLLQGRDLAASTTSSEVAVQPGEQEFTYSVTVSFLIK